MYTYARLLHKRDELKSVIGLLIADLQKKVTADGSVYESAQYLADCKAQLIFVECQISLLLFDEV